jgi:hypothetical protein
MIDIPPSEAMMAEESGRLIRAQRRCAIVAIIGFAVLAATLVYATMFVH